MNANARQLRRAPEVQSGDLDNPAHSTDRATPARPRPVSAIALAEPVKIAEFWKNRKGESIRATLVTYEGRNCFDLRQHFVAHDGRMQPTRKGITVAVLRLPALAAAVNAALARARELGLIEGEGSQ
jgi:hypothetical protein